MRRLRLKWLLRHIHINPRRDATMKEPNRTEETSRARSDELTEVIRAGARRLIAQALEAEVAELLAKFAGVHDEGERAAVVRNGYQPTREIQTGIGPVTVQVPKVRSRRGKAVSFHSAVVPPYICKSRSLDAALPWLYLKRGIHWGKAGRVRGLGGAKGCQRAPCRA